MRSFLIADIRGYTAYTAEHGDEAASHLTGEFAQIVAEGVTAWSGRLVELRGDEALAVFESPQMALLAASELQDAFADETAVVPDLPLRVGIGLDAGEAVAVGSGYRGAALNLAARLCGVSKAGEIHASVGLIELAGPVDRLAYDEVVGLDLKGVGVNQRAIKVRPTEPRARRDLLSTATEPSARTGLSPEFDVDVPLAGREAEMRWLGWHWRRALHGHARTVVVSGPAGVGKTRLVAELAAHAVRSGAWVRSAVAGVDADVEGALLDEVGAPPGLLVLADPAGASADPTAILGRISAADDPAGVLLVVIRSTVPVQAGAGAVGRREMRLPHLEVEPLDMEGVRELAAAQSPGLADELPLARILDESQGLPGRVRDSVAEWSLRVEAEREAAAVQDAAMPVERSSFIGRTEELEVSGRLLESSRLLTLIGPPGTGKTRLALRITADRADRYAGGSFFVPLAAVADARFVGSAIARSMRLRETASSTALEVAKAYLAERQALLVLDNFEHLLEAAPQVGALLDGAPELRIVVTSRAPLGLAGEQVYPVPPMRLPPLGPTTDVEALLAYDAVGLFLARARAADPAFDIKEANADTIISITAALDGLPLAIELAAARVRSLTPAQLLDRLEQRLRLLTGGPAEGGDRHRTMRNAIAWSYELLTEDEQSLLRSLSVFRGGFSLDAAAQVAERPDMEIVDGIDSLLAKSLLYRSVGEDEARFSMLEMVREFAEDELDAADERERIAEGHVRFYAGLARDAEPQLDGEAVGDGLVRLSAEIDNVRGALEHALAVGEAELALGLAASIWRFWQSMGQLEEGRYWLGRVLAADGGSGSARAKAHAALAGLAYWQGDFPASRASYVRARDLYRSAGDALGEADALYGLSTVATFEGDLDAAERQAQQAKAMFEELGAEAKVGEVLMSQAAATWSRGDLARARGLFEAALEISMRLDERPLAASQLIGVAGIAFQQGDTAQTMLRAGEGLAMAIEAGNTHTQVFALDAIASFTATSDPAAAVSLSSAAASLREAHGGGWTLGSFGVADAKAAVEGILSQTEIEDAWGAGAAWALEQAIGTARLILEDAGVDSDHPDLGL